MSLYQLKRATNYRALLQKISSSTELLIIGLFCKKIIESDLWSVSVRAPSCVTIVDVDHCKMDREGRWRVRGMELEWELLKTVGLGLG